MILFVLALAIIYARLITPLMVLSSHEKVAVPHTILLFFVANTNAANSGFFGARELVAAKGVGNSNVLLNTSKQLQTKFKHASDFGVVGNYNKVNAAKFSSALNQHINGSGTQIIQGAYGNSNNPVTFYLNP